MTRLSYTNWQRYLYTFVYYLAVPALLLRLWWRSIRHNREYRTHWQHRFGCIPPLTKQSVIWVHAVSMGETLAAVPLVKGLLERYPNYQIIMTSTTPTGAAQVIKHFGQQVVSAYLPYDLPDCVSRFLQRAHPDLGIILETELWPNLLFECARRRIPLLLANARLSARSCRGYRRIAGLARQMINSFTRVAAQASADGERFLQLGLLPERLEITGNIKFDIQLPADLSAQSQILRTSWGNRLVWVAASTHEGEESVILSAFGLIRARFPELLLVLVPRHPERFVKVAQLCAQAGYSVALRSQRQPITAETAILLGDTVGELMMFYAAADIAWVGGSLVPVGGHNLIEPAILGVPVLTGPHLHNFVDISQLLLTAGGAKVITDVNTLVNTVIELLQSPTQRAQMGRSGQQAVRANTGALAKHLLEIDRIRVSCRAAS